MANKIPTKVQFLLADAARHEPGGKVSLLGLYSGGILILNEKFPRRLPDGQQALGMPSLVIFVTILDGGGVLRCACELFSPAGKRMVGMKDIEIEKKLAGPANLIVPFTPFLFVGFGVYTFVLSIGSKNFTYQFTVKHINPKAKFPLPGKPVLDHAVLKKDAATGRLALEPKSKRMLRRGNR